MADLNELKDKINGVIVPRYQNKPNRFDVNNDGTVSPLDALLIINKIASLNRNQSQRANSFPLNDSTNPEKRFYDVNGDGKIEPLDALLVTNSIPKRR